MAKEKTAETVVEDLKQELDEVLEETPAEANRAVMKASPQPIDTMGQPIYSGEPGSVERMMEIALHNGGEQVLEILERLTALKNAQEDREAKMVFAEHFAKMQSEFVAIKKEKQGYNYKYAQLGKLEAHFGTAIANNGFSYSFEGQMMMGEEKEGWKRITVHIVGWGHERSNHFDVPPVEQTNSMNDVQALGSADTYGQRYAFIAGFGLPIQDEEDDDAASFGIEDVMENTEGLDAIKKSENATVLKENYSFYYKAAGTDIDRKLIMDAKDMRKAELAKEKK